MHGDIEFFSFHDKLTDKHHTATMEEGERALKELKAELGRTPKRDELLVRVLENKEAGK